MGILKFVEGNMNSRKHIETLGGIWMTMYLVIDPMRLKHRMKK